MNLAQIKAVLDPLEAEPSGFQTEQRRGAP
jgi:hypothetical protein